jgi:pyruvate/2-oxoglutarate dehydrogenase complex dihydrolipoamide acyltransferase (E2) component
MAVAIYVPRINNNDDEVKLVGIALSVGGRVAKGQTVAQVETDKAVVDVEAGSDGFVLAVFGQLDDVLTVGGVLAWVGLTADEAVPVDAKASSGASQRSAVPTAKANALLIEHGLEASQVPASGERLSVADVESFLASRGAGTPVVASTAALKETLPDSAGELKALKSEERGMLATVTWHRDVAVPGYIEINYDPKAWDDHAQAFGKEHGLLLSPLLPLMAWRLVELASDTPKLSATIVGAKRFEYSPVNLGFTVQAGDVLYLAVVRDALAQSELGFVNALVDLQRRAAGHKLGPLETQGATIGFSSMARWKVSRHIPILSPNTSVMVAHAVDADGSGVLGATYDHRVLHGSDVASMLRKLSRPRLAA